MPPPDCQTAVKHHNQATTVQDIEFLSRLIDFPCRLWVINNLWIILSHVVEFRNDRCHQSVTLPLSRNSQSRNTSPPNPHHVSPPTPPLNPQLLSPLPCPPSLHLFSYCLTTCYTCPFCSDIHASERNDEQRTHSHVDPWKLTPDL